MGEKVHIGIAGREKIGCEFATRLDFASALTKGRTAMTPACRDGVIRHNPAPLRAIPCFADWFESTRWPQRALRLSRLGSYPLLSRPLFSLSSLPRSGDSSPDCTRISFHMRSSRTRRRPRRLFLEHLPKRELLAGDLEFTQSADITGIEFEVAGEIFQATETNNPVVDIQAGQSIRITGIDYRIADNAPTEDGALAFEIYRRREHGALDVGSFDYTNGRFGSPIENSLAIGSVNQHPGVEEGWIVEDVDNRIAIIAIRYVGDQSNIEDRFFLDINSFVNFNVSDDVGGLASDDPRWTVSANSASGDSSINGAGQNNGAGGDVDARPLGVAILDGSDNPGQRFEIAVDASTTDVSDFANGFVIFDYEGENDFAYAGFRAIADEFVIGVFDGEFRDLASFSEPIELDQVYDLRVAVDGDRVALAADGVFKLAYEFDRDVNDGSIGVGNQRASTSFENLTVFENDTIRLGTSGEVVDLPAEVLEAQQRLEVARSAQAVASEQVSAARANLDQSRRDVAEARSAFRSARNLERSLRRGDPDSFAEAREARIDAAADLAEARQARRDAATELRSARVESRAVRREASRADRAFQRTLANFSPEDLPNTVYALNFNHQDNGELINAVGGSETLAGQLHLLPDGETDLAISLINDDALPERTETRAFATLRADQVEGRFANGFIIFDYQSPTDFKYAGAWAGADQWSIGHHLDGQWNNLATLDAPIGEGPALDLQIWIQQNQVTLLVAGEPTLIHQFDASVDGGSLGVGSLNAQSRFDQVAVLPLHGADAPETSLSPQSTETIAAVESSVAAIDTAITELF